MIMERGGAASVPRGLFLALGEPRQDGLGAV
jgi:hypothetical protein